MQGGSFVDLWARLTGLEMLDAIAQDQVPPPPSADHVGITVGAASAGKVDFTWQPTPAIRNPSGDVHGGYLAMVLDDAAASACATVEDRFWPMLTLTLHVDFVRPVRVGTEYRVTGSLVHRGRRRSVADAVIVDPDDRVCARATGSFTPNVDFDPRRV